MKIPEFVEGAHHIAKKAIVGLCVNPRCRPGLATSPLLHSMYNPILGQSRRGRCDIELIRVHRLLFPQRATVNRSSRGHVNVPVIMERSLLGK